MSTENPGDLTSSSNILNQPQPFLPSVVKPIPSVEIKGIFFQVIPSWQLSSKKRLQSPNPPVTFGLFSL